MISDECILASFDFLLHICWQPPHSLNTGLLGACDLAEISCVSRRLAGVHVELGFVVDSFFRYFAVFNRKV